MSLATYTSLITSEHNDKPNFMAVIAALCQPFVDGQAVLNAMPQDYDIDTAVAAQLDTVGLWVGQSRNITTPLTGVYFALDTAGVGLDQGTWFGPFDSTTGLTSLPDDSYRVLLKAKIANNQWAGNVPDAYVFLDQVFPGDQAFIQDNGDMTMLLGVVGSTPLNAVTYALLTNGYLDVKPVGVRINYYVTPSVVGAPIFGFDVENTTISGLDVGGWATLAGGR